MEDVRIYDFEFNLLHIEHDIKSCNWTFYENEVGSFEMHFPITSGMTSVIMRNQYLVAVQGSKQAIITGRQIDTEGVLYGRSCNWILTRFCTSEEFNTDTLYDEGIITAKDAQTVCAYLMGLAPEGIFTIESNAEDNFGEVFLENKGITSIFNLVQSCLSKDDAGHEVVFDVRNKRWVFRVTKGKRRNVILSEENRNAHQTEYSEDMQDYFTGGWYEQEMENVGEWNADTNTPYLTDGLTENFAKAYRVTVAGTCFDIHFDEGEYIVCDDKAGAWKKADKIESFPVHIPSALAGIYAWETPLDGSTEERAKEALSQKNTERTIKTKTRSFLFGRDYHLGDRVSVQMRKGDLKTAGVKKITGVNLWYEENDIGEQPIMEEVEN